MIELAARLAVRRATGEPVQDLLLAAARAMAARLDQPLTLVEPLAKLATSSDVAPVDLGLGAVTPELLGLIHERLLTDDHRHDAGVHYTPQAVAAGVAELVFAAPTRWAERVPVVCDPTVGGGAFLLAAGRRLESFGHTAADIVTRGLVGADIDPLAVAVARTGLGLWAGSSPPPDALVVADTLAEAPWRSGSVDVVVGNPPFLSQLGRRTARGADGARALRQRLEASGLDSAISAYTDTAALFLLVALELVGETGTVALVEPLSLVSARDAQGVRDAVAERTGLCDLWYGPVGTFDAAVSVCVPVIVSGSEQRAAVKLWSGLPMQPMASVPMVARGESWGPMIAPLLGIPDARLDDANGTVGDLATATAGFRDEYYAIAAATIDDGQGLPVVSVGSIDPLRSYWGQRRTKLAKREYLAPTVALTDMADTPKIAAWVQRLNRPKLLVATQSATIEVWVDEDGTAVPLTPVVAVLAEPDELWRLAAVLSSPAATAWGAARTAGAARSVRALKLAAREVLEVPLPADRDAWGRGAGWAKRAQWATDFESWNQAMTQLADAMNHAYGVGSDVGDWWSGRLDGARRRVQRADATRLGNPTIEHPG